MSGIGPDAERATPGPGVVANETAMHEAGGRRTQQPSRRRPKLTNALGAIAAQGIQAISSFAFQILAVKTIGIASYGRFVILLGLLITLSALLAGFRDAGIVNEVYDPGLRTVANASQLALALVSGVLGALAAAAFADSSTTQAALFGLAVVLWAVEEIGRRQFMGRLRFPALVINDASYLLGAMGALAVLCIIPGHYSIDRFLLSMAAGSLISFALAFFVQLGPSSFAIRPRKPGGLRTVLSFAAWRSAQGVITPLEITFLRVGTKWLQSAAVLGTLESGRLFIAPGLVVVQGISTFLLPTFARLSVKPRAFYSYMRRVVLYQFVAMVIVSGAIVEAYPFLVRILLNPKDPAPSLVTVVSWTVMLTVTVVSQPVGVGAIALRKTRVVFVCRLADGLVGLALGLALVATGHTELAPLGLAAGALVGMALIWRLAHSAEYRRSRRGFRGAAELAAPSVAEARVPGPSNPA